jgi:uncharacterized cupin superfamily protein
MIVPMNVIFHKCERQLASKQSRRQKVVSSVRQYIGSLLGCENIQAANLRDMIPNSDHIHVHASHSEVELAVVER